MGEISSGSLLNAVKDENPQALQDFFTTLDLGTPGGQVGAGQDGVDTALLSCGPKPIPLPTPPPPPADADADAVAPPPVPASGPAPPPPPVETSVAAALPLSDALLSPGGATTPASAPSLAPAPAPAPVTVKFPLIVGLELAQITDLVVPTTGAPAGSTDNIRVVITDASDACILDTHLLAPPATALDGRVTAGKDPALPERGCYNATTVFLTHNDTCRLEAWHVPAGGSGDHSTDALLGSCVLTVALVAESGTLTQHLTMMGTPAEGLEAFTSPSAVIEVTHVHIEGMDGPAATGSATLTDLVGDSDM